VPTHRTDQKTLNAILKILPSHRCLSERHCVLSCLIGLSAPFITLLCLENLIGKREASHYIGEIHTGTDAIRRAATFRPDIALLGVVMPEMDGVETAVKLPEICPEMRIVLVTESVPTEMLEHLKAQGYHFPMLPVTFSQEELHAVVFGDAPSSGNRVKAIGHESFQLYRFSACP
jgi:CheY-like chemotaxis protein